MCVPFLTIRPDRPLNLLNLQKLDRLTPPADDHNTTGQYNPAVHGNTGAPCNVHALPAY
jgi:hypothetical protein